MNSRDRKQVINDACKAANCQNAERHAKLYVHEHWHAHPSKEFEIWFTTDRYCIDSELNICTAWNSSYFRNLFSEAKAIGWDEFDAEPPRPLTHAEIVAMTARQKAKFPALKALIAAIGRPVPAPLPTDWDKEAVGAPSYAIRD